MTIIQKVADSPFHLQDKVDFCGAAVGLMMLADMDVGVPAESLLEDDLYKEGEKNSNLGANMLIDPNGLVSMLNKFRPRKQGKFDRTFALTKPKGTAVVVAHLRDSAPISPAVVFFGNEHWVTVEGVWMNGDPAQGSYTLLMLLIHDPLAIDDVDKKHCANDKCRSKGIPDRYEIYPQGWNDKFSGAVIKRRVVFIVVGREGFPSTPEPHGIVFPDPLALGIELVGGFIMPNNLPKLWDSFLDIYGGLPPNSSASEFLSGATPNAAVLVEWIGRDKIFYLVTLEREGEIVGTWVVDARNGVSDSIEVHRPDAIVRPFYMRLKADLSRETLVWQPCLESSSPHLPFRRNSQDGSYERLDRRVFPRLTTHVNGNQ